MDKKLIRKTITEIGYNDPELKFDSNSCEVMIKLDAQSPDISQGITANENKEQGAGDQGLMFGYATNETEELMPLPILLAHKLTKKLTDIRKNGELTWVRPDGKSQVSVRYEDEKPKQGEINSQILYSEPKSLNTNKDLPTVSKNSFKKGVYY